MTKEEFRKEIAYYTGPNSRWPKQRQCELNWADGVRPFDVKLADLVEKAVSAWADVYEHMKSRAER